MEIGSAIVVICGLMASLIQLWQSKKTEQESTEDVTNIQTERQALENGNIDAVAADQHDRVQQALDCSERRRNSDSQEVNH